MFRLLSILAFGVALCIPPDRASADPMWTRKSSTSETSSRQRITHHRHYWITIGYDPLPYRYGSASTRGRPYRYYWKSLG
jgi:hypothetical protein